MEAIKWACNRMPKSDDRNLSIMSLPNVAKARFFHSGFPQYSITPLAELDGMAKYLGLGGLYVKNEARRFGLNAFRARSPSSRPPTETMAGASPGPPTSCGRRRWSTCPRAAASPGLTTLPPRGRR